ncbi:unnamed protein product [Sphagnum jensenii]|uniref:Uncharacterized protein n=1 Tax=Sphagnum jensenii TaxID=128206 RepID=A0ABP0VIA1_9BRYO
MNSNTIPFEQVILRYHPNWFLKLLGFRYLDDGTYRFKWGSFDPQAWGLKFNIVQFSADEEYDCLWNLSFIFIIGHFWINLPKWLPNQTFGDDIDQNTIRTWGFDCRWRRYAVVNGIVFDWDTKSRSVIFPWSVVRVREQYLMKDGSWADVPEDCFRNPEIGKAFRDGQACEQHTYHWVTPRWGIRETIATLRVNEVEYRPKCFSRLSIFRDVRRYIDISFAKPVGVVKGGVLQTFCELKLGETPAEALTRFMKTTNL